jgi:hypothetical protein
MVVIREFEFGMKVDGGRTYSHAVATWAYIAFRNGTTIGILGARYRRECTTLCQDYESRGRHQETRDRAYV